MHLKENLPTVRRQTYPVAKINFSQISPQQIIVLRSWKELKLKMAFSASILVIVNLLVPFASSETGLSHKHHHAYSSNRYKLGNELRLDEIREALFCRHLTSVRPNFEMTFMSWSRSCSLRLYLDNWPPQFLHFPEKSLFVLKIKLNFALSLPKKFTTFSATCLLMYKFVLWSKVKNFSISFFDATSPFCFLIASHFCKSSVKTYNLLMI